MHAEVAAQNVVRNQDRYQYGTENHWTPSAPCGGRLQVSLSQQSLQNCKGQLSSPFFTTAIWKMLQSPKVLQFQTPKQLLPNSNQQMELIILNSLSHHSHYSTLTSTLINMCSSWIGLQPFFFLISFLYCYLSNLLIVCEGFHCLPLLL